MTHTLVFPKIVKIELDQFSLYSREPNIQVDVSNGVFCLVGANGLGKSTFLAAVNFAITGIVRDPNRKFESVDEYYKYTLGYSNQFFDGRILEEDREIASISINLQVDHSLYKLTRGVFEPDELRELIILNSDGEIDYEGSDQTASERQQYYKDRITKDIGLATFQQFVFLQHFVLTFDESRHLLLWDQRALNQALFLCMGTDYKKAQTADKLYRDMERAASLARNYSWRASEVSSEIEMLRKALQRPESEIDLTDLGSQYDTLQNELGEIEKIVDYKKSQFNDAQLKWMEASSETITLQDQYSKEFSRYTRQHSNTKYHPLITTSISQAKCEVCGTEGEEVVKTIQSKIEQSRCPLCDSSLSEEIPATDSMLKLQELDKEIANAKKRLSSSRQAMDRISDEVKSVEVQRSTKFSELQDFEAKNERYLYQLKSDATDEEMALQKKTDELNTYLERKKNKYAERDKIKNEYLQLQRELEDMYSFAQMKFVPSFRDLAKLFLGIDVDIRMDFSRSVTSPGVVLTLEMRGSVRRQEQQLSESQRFFLDIALRMALAQYVSDEGAEAGLFIDTPEGSLDIAYESRVGQMFAKFVMTNHDIMMTANINSSQILRRLALECGKERMTLHRMTSWTELSDVQLEEEHLFRDAMAKIEKALDVKERPVRD
ncbi:MAG: hypothetical protein KDJ97_15465 [Anaerolineae bacterium]|nr:hypothetical protein [Anaerolineae bacterium]